MLKNQYKSCLARLLQARNSQSRVILHFTKSISDRHGHLPSPCNTVIHTFIPHVENHRRQWSHMGFFQSAFPKSLTIQGGTRENSRSGGLWKLQQRETWKNGRRFQEFFVSDVSTWFIIHQTDYDKRKSVYAIKQQEDNIWELQEKLCNLKLAVATQTTREKVPTRG